MSRWFRIYDEMLDDPKVQRLPAEDFKGWMNLLCLASRNDGKLPHITDIAFALRETEDAVSTLLERLLNGGLIERRSGGADGMHYAPYRWNERQYKSDTSTVRVKRFRERSKPVAETPPETDTETEYSEAKASAAVQVIDPETVMWRHGKLYLQSQGISADRAGAMLGKWKKSHGAEAVIIALGKAQREGALDPVSFITGCLGSKRGRNDYNPDRITV